MTVENNNMSGRSNEPGQIDLIDIVAQLWRGKVTIIVCAVFTILLAALYLVQATERWT